MNKDVKNGPIQPRKEPKTRKERREFNRDYLKYSDVLRGMLQRYEDEDAIDRKFKTVRYEKRWRHECAYINRMSDWIKADGEWFGRFVKLEYGEEDGTEGTND